MTDPATNTWSSLELAKLIASVLTPAAIAFLGIYVQRVSKRFDATLWKSQKLVEKRLAVYDDLGPHFNDLLCYFTYVGCWKELSPSEVVALKRTMDRKIYLAAPLFPVSFFHACQYFQSCCFETYGGWGRDARLRTKFERRRQAAEEWTPASEECFSSPANVTDPRVVREAYAAVMREFTRSFGMECESEVLSTGQVPSNIK